MKNLKSLTMALATLGMVAGGTLEASGGGAGCAANTEMTLEKAREQAEKSGLPVLIKVQAEWCTACKAFDQAVASQADFEQKLDQSLVLCRVDGEKGEGKQIAKQYNVHGYPSFILTDAKGEVLDRWMGYKEQTDFLHTLDQAVTEPMTLQDRMARFQKEPSEKDAKKLGDLRYFEGLHAEATAYYRRAAELNPESDTHYETLILATMAGGAKNQIFSVPQIKAQANAVVASHERDDKDLMKVAYTMGKVAWMSHDKADFLPYLKIAIEETADATDQDIIESRAKLLPDYAMHITKEVDQAIAYKKASMPADWMTNPDMLNNFAWWCFENEVNIKEAEDLARKGVALATPGTQKANILDTLAELCNLSGNCSDAVGLIRQAIAEAPENEYFKNQLTRFETLLANQQN